MKKIFSIVFVLSLILLFSEVSKASEVDILLNKAKKEKKIVMLELGSVGCIPCEQMKPVMERLKKDFRGKLEVIFIDVRVDSYAARKFGVYVIPTQVFIDKNGREFHRHIGYYPYESIVYVLKKAGL